MILIVLGTCALVMGAMFLIASMSVSNNYNSMSAQTSGILFVIVAVVLIALWVMVEGLLVL